MNLTGLLSSLVLISGSCLMGWLVQYQPIPAPPLAHLAQQDPEHPAEEELPPRESLVQDWARPDVTLFISGRQNGYIEPCGCTGLENQKGGLMRRSDCQQILRQRGWPMVSLDAGQQIRRLAVQSRLKLQATYETMTRVMKYDGIGLGIEELKLSGAQLAQAIFDCETPEAFVCCNIEVLQEGVVAPYRVQVVNGKRIGFTAVLGEEFFDMITEEDIRKTAPKAALTQVAQRLQAERCDVKVLLAQTSKAECLKLAQLFPLFDLIVVGDCVGEPTALPETVIGPNNHVTHVIECGDKGMYVGIVGCYWQQNRLQIKYERVPMDARFQDEPQAKNIFVGYQKNLEQLYNRPADFPDITPRKTPTGRSYIGSTICADCHEEEYEIWKEGVDGEGGPHARGTEDLINPLNNPRAEIKRNFDPECLSCHVTGWNPQNYFPYETGYLDLERDVDLHGNGCENCHGPGREHAEAENDGADEETLKRLQLAMRVTLDQARQGLCVECHDADNSPDFLKKGFDVYWEKIKH